MNHLLLQEDNADKSSSDKSESDEHSEDEEMNSNTADI